jgi:hypothetical protein
MPPSEAKTTRSSDRSGKCRRAGTSHGCLHNRVIDPDDIDESTIRPHSATPDFPDQIDTIICNTPASALHSREFTQNLAD